MLEDRNDLAFWFPRIAAAGLPVPLTLIVETDCDLMSVLDGVLPEGFDVFDRELRDAADSIGYPCFLRTGHTSGKHEWGDTFFVQNRDVLVHHMVALVEASVMADFMGLPTDSWAVRELIPNVPLFTLDYYGGMPYVPEWRLFVDGGVVTHIQPYWPMDALEEGQPSIRNWREVVASFFAKMSAEQAAALLGPMAVKAAEACDGGHWSVDFLWSSVNGIWWLTDMADGDRSFRYEP